MTPENPVVRVWRRDGPVFRQVVSGGLVTRYEQLSAEWVRNAPGPWSLTLPLMHRQAEVFLGDKRCWVTVDLPGRGGVRFTGRVDRLAPAQDDDGRQVLEVSGLDAFAAVLGGVLCYPDPGASGEQQLLVRYTDKGATEDLLRRLIVRNVVERRKAPVTVAQSQGRGRADQLDLAFDPLRDVVSVKATAGNLGVRVGLVDTAPGATTATMRVDFIEGRDRVARATLSPASGTVRSWRQEEIAPTGTRAVVAAAYRERTYTVASVNLDTDVVHLTANHQLRTGDVVRFAGKADPPAPVQTGQAYYAIHVGTAGLRVAATRAQALAGAAVNLSAAPTAGALTVTEITRTVREVVAPGGAEAEWDRVAEVYVDARGASEDEADAAVVAEVGLEGLKDHLEQGNAEVVTAESQFIRFGLDAGQLYLGDRGRLELVPGWSREEQLSAARLTVGDAGAKVELVFGNPATTPMRRQAELYRALLRRQRKLERGE